MQNLWQTSQREAFCDAWKHWNPLSAGDPPRAPLGELTTFPQIPSRLGGGNPFPIPTPLDVSDLDAFGASNMSTPLFAAGDRFCSYYLHQLSCSLSRCTIRVRICTLTTRRSTASVIPQLLRMECSCNDGCLHASTSWRRGCGPLNSTSIHLRPMLSGIRKSTTTSTTSVRTKSWQRFCYTPCVHDLGICVDSDASMRTHVSRPVSTCFTGLRQNHSIT